VYGRWEHGQGGGKSGWTGNPGGVARRPRKTWRKQLEWGVRNGNLLTRKDGELGGLLKKHF